MSDYLAIASAYVHRGLPRRAKAGVSAESAESPDIAVARRILFTSSRALQDVVIP